MMRFFAQCQAQAKLAGASSHVVITDPSAGMFDVLYYGCWVGYMGGKG